MIKKEKKNILLALDVELAEKIDELADKEYMSRTGLLKAIIIRHILEANKTNASSINKES